MNAPERPMAVLHGLDAAEYHQMPGLGSSALAALARSPWHYWAEYLNPDRPQRTATAAMSAGTLAHCAILEPAAFHDRYQVRPDGIDLRTKDGKAWAASVPAGLEIITAEQMATAKGQREAVLAVPELAMLLTEGESEVSVFATDPETGAPIKARLDRLHMLQDGRAIVFDLKTTTEPSAAEFARSVYKYGYFRQEAHYRAVLELASGIEVAAFVFGAVSSTYPYLAVPYVIDDEALQRGAEQRRELLRTYARCMADGIWPTPTEGVQVLTLPPWAK